MTTLQNTINAINVICSTYKVAGNDKKTFLGHSSNKGLQGQTDLALLGKHPKIDYTNLTTFCCSLASLETSLKTTASCQEAALTTGKNKNISIELRPHDAYHGAWKTWQKLAYLSGNTGERDRKQLVKFFEGVNGCKREAFEALQKAIIPLFKEITDLKNGLLLEGKGKRVHCFVEDDKGVNELQTRVFDLQQKVAVKQEIEKAFEPVQVPEIDLEKAYQELATLPISATVIIKRKK